MTRAIVLSDSHGMGDDLRWLLDDIWKRIGSKPVDWYIHCGDGASDMDRVRDYINQHDRNASFCQVRGNCDFRLFDIPNTARLLLGGVPVWVTHGHLYHVKSGLLNLDYAAAEQGCSIALYGHTHIPAMDNGRCFMINPGSAADHRAALLEVEAGKPNVQLLRL